jgi:hypothetical protein
VLSPEEEEEDYGDEIAAAKNNRKIMTRNIINHSTQKSKNASRLMQSSKTLKAEKAA